MLQNQIKEAGHKISKQFDEDVFIIENFVNAELCRSVVNLSHRLMRDLPHREIINGAFFSFDVLPQNTETERIFRTLQIDEFSDDLINGPIYKLFSLMEDFQSSLISKGITVEEGKKKHHQVIHYPKGGGFFDWHEHPRFPVNYGMICNLSEKGKNFDVGATEIVSSKGDLICVEDFSNIGDLILFKYDLRHRVAPCNPDEDLVFDTNGRWTAILPIY